MLRCGGTSSIEVWRNAISRKADNLTCVVDADRPCGDIARQGAQRLNLAWFWSPDGGLNIENLRRDAVWVFGRLLGKTHDLPQIIDPKGLAIIAAESG